MAAAAARADGFDIQSANELLRSRCADCHAPEVAEDGFDISVLEDEASLLEARHLWTRVRERVMHGEMPPEGSEEVPDEARDRLVEWIDAALVEAACRGGAVAGPAPLRRLNRAEYSNTIHDLLGVHFDAGATLPADGAGGEGFNNAAETLILSPIHAEKYLEAGKEALEYVARDQTARGRFFTAEPDEETPPREAARRVLERLAERAYRRPVGEEDLEPLLRLFDAAWEQQGEQFEPAVLYAATAVLVSPHFLFRIEQPVEGAEPEPADDYELATRLSYFLWSSMPDEKLMKAAREGRLAGDAEARREQVLRMLEDDRLREAAGAIAGQWLGTAELGVSIAPDAELFPHIDDPFRAAMRDEPVYTLETILREGRSVLDLIDADWTFLNHRLASHYQLNQKDLEIRDRRSRERLQERLVECGLPEGSRRGGLVSMAGVLAISSYPNRTSPVLRGKWILETMLGETPPEPPPNIPELEESAEAVEAETLRERLEQHRADPSCAACHDRLDPIGFALENYDAAGRWRDEEPAGPIDATGTLPDGGEIDGVDGLKDYLMSRKDDFLRHLTRKMLGYALGRGLRTEDECTVQEIVERVRDADYSAHELILGIVESPAFRMKPGAEE